MKTFVQLGRYGDIINVLPLLKAESEKGPVRLVVAKNYADLLDGVSYVEPAVWNGPFEKLPEALAWARGEFGEVVNLQVYGHGWNQRRVCGSFCEEAWNNGGALDLFNTLPLVFDRRDRKRERWLLDEYTEGGKPLILLGLQGNSSPFPLAVHLRGAIRVAFPDCEVVDLAKVQAERSYDLLGLYDRAAALVAIDTMHLHLAPASKVPTVALFTDRPTAWHGTPGKPGVHTRLPYSIASAPEGMEAIIRALGLILRPPVQSDVVLFHTYAEHEATGETARRQAFAARTWANEYARGQWAAVPFVGERNATGIGYHRDLPYLRDLVAAAASKAKPSDIIVLTNTDTCLGAGLTEVLQDGCRRWGAVFAHRHDFHRLDQPRQPGGGKWYPGSDLFAFTREWWDQHGAEVPDLLLGAEFVDCVLRQVIKRSGGGEVCRAIYHERHASEWERKDRRQSDVANAHNRTLAERWFAETGYTDRDPWTHPVPDFRKLCL